MGSPHQTCFIIGPIGPDNSPTREDADQLVKLVLRDVLKIAGFECQRADDISRPGHITKDIISRLRDSDVVIADLREINANVYYELSFRNVVRKAVIAFAQKGEELPFDIKETRIIPIDIRDPDSVYDARQLLTCYLGDLPAPDTADSPLSVALDSIKLEQGGALDRAIARISQATDLLPSIHERVHDTDDSIMYKTAQSMLQAAVYGSLERIVMDLQQSEDECSARCLGLIREIERDLMQFADAPYLSDGF